MCQISYNFVKNDKFASPKLIRNAAGECFRNLPAMTDFLVDMQRLEAESVQGGRRSAKEILQRTASFSWDPSDAQYLDI